MSGPPMPCECPRSTSGRPSRSTGRCARARSSHPSNVKSHGTAQAVSTAGAALRPDDEFLWTNERWRLHTLDGPTGLPVNVILVPREHFAELGDLPDDLAAELGIMLARIERAVRSVGEIGRVARLQVG